MFKLIKLKDIFVLLIKYIPIIQMVGMLINNSLFYFDICRSICYCMDFTIGNSIVATILLYICSNLFGFCNWHRLIITSNLINLLISFIDVLFHIPIKDHQLLILYFIVYTIFLFIIIYKRFCK